MKTYEMFDINLDEKELLAFIGGGGKTTTIFKLANELKNIGKKILITTTTAIFYPNKGTFDKIYIDESDDIISKLSNIENNSITIIGRSISKENKLLGIKKEIIDEIYKEKVFDYILVEADGSKRKTIKCPDNHEPVIPQSTNKTVGVIGLDAIGLKINDDNVHRAELFKEITNSEINDIINEETIFKLITNNKGLFKGTPINSKRYILLNKMDNKKREESARVIANLLLKSDFNFNGLISGSMLDEANSFIRL